jgi:transcriptional regulator with GAF, ATPase, and Fis domain
MENPSSFIFKLIGISSLLEGQADLEAGLREVAALAGQLLGTQRCAILLLSEQENSETNTPYLKVFTQYDNHPASVQKEVTQFNNGIAGYVAATAKPLLIKDISQSQFTLGDRDRHADHKSLMAAPIILGDSVIGTINTSHPLHKASFGEEDLELLKLVAAFVGKSIHVAQLQTILRSKFVEMAVAYDLNDQKVEESIILNPNPNKLAKIVAKSFFRELTKAGFGPNQIIEIATEVLNLLQKTIDKHKQRLERDESEFLPESIPLEKLH